MFKMNLISEKLNILVALLVLVIISAVEVLLGVVVLFLITGFEVNKFVKVGNQLESYSRV